MVDREELAADASAPKASESTQASPLLKGIGALASGHGSAQTRLAIVLGILALAAGVSLFLKFSGLYLVAFALVVSWYAVVSGPSSTRAGIDSSLVAEQIVAMGVASLILHVALAAFSLRDALQTSKTISTESVFTAARWFGEGLICATLAPLAAMWVRMRSAVQEGAYTEAKQPSLELESGGSWVEATQTMLATTAKLEAQVERYNSALQDLTTATGQFGARLSEAGHSVSVTFESTLAQIEASLANMANRFDDVTRNVELQVNQLNTTLDAIGRGIDGVSQPIVQSFAAAADGVRMGGQEIAHGLNDAAVELRASGRVLSDEFRVMAAGFGENGRSIAIVLEGLPKAISERIGAIGREVDPLVTHFAALGKSLASVQDSSVQLAQDLPQLYATSSMSVARLSEEVDGLATKLKEGALLLEGLQDLISAVRRFIPVEGQLSSAALKAQHEAT